MKTALLPLLFGLFLPFLQAEEAGYVWDFKNGPVPVWDDEYRHHFSAVDEGLIVFERGVITSAITGKRALHPQGLFRPIIITGWENSERFSPIRIFGMDIEYSGGPISWSGLTYDDRSLIVSGRSEGNESSGTLRIRDNRGLVYARIAKSGGSPFQFLSINKIRVYTQSNEPESVGEIVFATNEASTPIQIFRDKQIIRLEAGTEVGTKIRVGDEIITPARTSLRIEFTSGTRVNVGQRTKFKIEEFQNEKEGYFLRRGSVQTKFIRIDSSRKSNLIIKTKTTAIGVRGTEFISTYEEENGVGRATVELLEGALDFENLLTGEIIDVPVGETRMIETALADLPPTVVTSIADSGPGSLREILETIEEGTIVFDEALSGQTIRLEGEALEILGNQKVVIDASALENGLTIDGDYKSRIFDIGFSTEVEIRGLHMTKGFSYTGGGGIENSGRLAIYQSTISDCRTRGPGGGLYHTGNISNRCLLVNCTFYNNRSYELGFGGWGQSGAIYQGGGAGMILYHCTITGNDGGVHCDSGGGVWLRNSIVAGNLQSAGASDLSDGDSGGRRFESYGNNILGVGIAMEDMRFLDSFWNARVFHGRDEQSIDLLDVEDPMLGVLYPSGGPTPVCFPLTGSPAINAVTLAASDQWWYEEIPTTDQRGLARVSGVRSDTGAVEVSSGESSPRALALEWEDLVRIYDGNGFVFKPLVLPEDRGEFEVTIRRPSTIGDLVVNLTSESPEKLRVPDQVVIPNGEDSVTLSLSSVNNERYEGLQKIGILASSTGFANSLRSILVGDDEEVIVVSNTNDSGPGSLRAAIEEVPPFASIKFSPELNGATIRLTDGSLDLAGAEFTIDASDLSQGITVNGNDSHEYTGGSDAGFDLARISYADLVFKNITLSGSYGLHCLASKLTFYDSTIRSNGLIYQVPNFSAPINFRGGGLYVDWDSEVRFFDCEIVDNFVATNPANPGTFAIGTFGGGIYSSNSSVHLERTTIAGNSAGSNGGALNGVGFVLKDCSVFMNTAGLDGGAAAASLTATGTTFYRNSAGKRGGALEGARLELTNCTITENTAVEGGGGIYGISELRNCTISGNSSTGGSGGGILAKDLFSGTTYLTHTIVSGNSPSDFDIEEGANFTSWGYNLIGTGNGFSNPTGIAGDQIGVTDPELGPLQYNGGATKTMALLPTSPAIDAGWILSPVDTDQRGNSRSAGAAPDLGAFEYNLFIDGDPTYEDYALAHGLETDPARLSLDGNGNGVPDLLDYALGILESTPEERQPVFSSFSDAGEDLLLTFSFSLPPRPRQDVIINVVASNSLESDDWEVVASKQGDGPWTGDLSVVESFFVGKSTEVDVSLTADSEPGDRMFYRLEVLLESDD